MTPLIPPTLSESSDSSSLRALSPQELSTLVRLATPRMTKYLAQSPTETQAAFLLAGAREVLFGGAAGGGKSSALLMAALQYVDVPGYSAILFRRTFADLAKAGALMDRSHQWLRGTDAAWNGQQHAWRFPSGAVLAFGHLEHEADKYDHQGAEYQFCGFDELTHFSETQYRYLFSRLRKLRDSNVPLRMRGGSNPGGEGHEWVHRRFIASRTPGRVFIPAKLEDNPHLDRASYEESLAELDPVTRKQLRHGDWNVKEAGEYFKREWLPMLSAPPHCTRIVRYWDMAATEAKPGKDPDWTVGVKMGLLERGGYVVLDVRRFRKGPASTEKEVGDTAKLDGLGVEQHFEQEPGSSGKAQAEHFQRDVCRGFAAYAHKVTGDKVTRAKPFSAACEQGRVSVVAGPWYSAWMDVLEGFPAGSHDDDVDGSSGAYNALHVAGEAHVPRPLTASVRTGLSGSDM